MMVLEWVDGDADHVKLAKYAMRRTAIRVSSIVCGVAFAGICWASKLNIADIPNAAMYPGHTRTVRLTVALLQT